MSAKRKSSDQSSEADAYKGTAQNPELEKKVDELLSVDRPVKSETSADTPPGKTIEPETPAPAEVSQVQEPDDAVSGPPLLPSDKLPNLDKQKSSQKEPLPVAEEADTGFVSPRSEISPDDVGQKPPATQAESNAAYSDDLGLEDPGTSNAVDEIVASETAETVAPSAAEKIPTAEAPRIVPAPAKDKAKRSLLSAWWHNKLARNSTLTILLLGIAAVMTFPTSRYLVLNAAGVRSSASVTVLDETSGQPLKNVDFSIADKTGKTDIEGKARVGNLRLGDTTMVVKKPAFADYSQPVTIGWGSNPLGEYKLKAVGNQYRIIITDFLTKKAVAKAEVSSGEANARANDKGEAILTVPQSDKAQIEIQVTADTYRAEKLTLSVAQKDEQPVAVEMVPARKHAFISKRSGRFDVYKIDVDGKNEEKVLAGTGREQSEAMALSAHPTKNIVALVSSRENIRNADGFGLSTLNIIDLKDNSATKVTQSERIQLVEWIGSRLVYVKITEGASNASVDRHRLMSYDTDTGTEKELASTNYFNDILAVNGSIYYSPAAFNVNGSVGLYKVNAEGNNKKTIYDKEVWNLFRTSYDKLSVSIGQEWFELSLDSDGMSRASGPPPVLKTRVYFDSPYDSSSLWVDERDGKGTLVSYDRQNKEDKVLHSQSGLKNPVRWLNERYITYRVSSNQETADYVLNLDGGEPRKIRDVTDTAGIDRWYYY